MSNDLVSEFQACLVGRTCLVARREHDWLFDLTGGATLAVSVPWRIVSGGRIVFGSEDDGHWFGLPSPKDGEVECHKLLGHKPITSAEVDRETADLTLHFDKETRIDVFNNSCGYEGWQARYPVDDGARDLVAMGGGEIVFF